MVGVAGGKLEIRLRRKRASWSLRREASAEEVYELCDSILQVPGTNCDEKELTRFRVQIDEAERGVHHIA